MTDDEKVMLMSFFPFGARSTLEVGGDYAKDVLTPRASAALEGLVAAGLVTVDKPFVDPERQRFTGTDGAPRFDVRALDAAWPVIMPNPRRKIRRKNQEAAPATPAQESAQKEGNGLRAHCKTKG